MNVNRADYWILFKNKKLHWEWEWIGSIFGDGFPNCHLDLINVTDEIEFRTIAEMKFHNPNNGFPGEFGWSWSWNRDLTDFSYIFNREKSKTYVIDGHYGYSKFMNIEWIENKIKCKKTNFRPKFPKNGGKIFPDYFCYPCLLDVVTITSFPGGTKTEIERKNDHGEPILKRRFLPCFSCKTKSSNWQFNENGEIICKKCYIKKINEKQGDYHAF